MASQATTHASGRSNVSEGVGMVQCFSCHYDEVMAATDGRDFSKQLLLRHWHYIPGPGWKCPPCVQASIK